MISPYNYKSSYVDIDSLETKVSYYTKDRKVRADKNKLLLTRERMDTIGPVVKVVARYIVVVSE